MKTYKTETIPADSDKSCDCCGRHHRKMTKVDGIYWMVQNCEEQYYLYQRNKDIKSLTWKGWERQYQKIKKMVTGK